MGSAIIWIFQEEIENSLLIRAKLIHLLFAATVSSFIHALFMWFPLSPHTVYHTKASFSRNIQATGQEMNTAEILEPTFLLSTFYLFTYLLQPLYSITGLWRV